jgi:hypothetical protein
MPSLDFDVKHRYLGGPEGIEIPVALCAGSVSVEFLAKVDTGAASCVFERKYGEMLGIGIEGGRLQRFRTVTGAFTAFEHEVTIQTLGIEFSAFVYFAEDLAFNRNVLGRSGWLANLTVGIVDYDRTVYLAPYRS